MNIQIFINIVTFVLVTLNYQRYNDENAFGKSLKNGSKLNISLDTNTLRSLAMYEKENDLISSRFQHNTHGNRHNEKLLNERYNNNTYERLKTGKPNNIESYLNSFKYRYSKKSGLKKLDCYYEKKIFNSIYKIEKMVEQNNVGSYRITRSIIKKFGPLLFIINLIPLLVFVIPVKEIRKKYNLKTSGYALYKNRQDVTDKTVLISKFTDSSVRCFFLCMLIIIMLSLIIYIYIKTLKYKRIRSCMLK
ncbi:Protein of unknown function, putative [Plasmodium vivax]|uniref:Uncharacterized protein n=1 Tax=Plasmodium vivax TaxID=5855 RepID=A0A1G4EEF3_PLAVI|nr:Protein of unknown function, putative [Plasmodium vivax]